jgi:hypothetical protein
MSKAPKLGKRQQEIIKKNKDGMFETSMNHTELQFLRDGVANDPKACEMQLNYIGMSHPIRLIDLIDELIEEKEKASFEIYPPTNNPLPSPKVMGAVTVVTAVVVITATIQLTEQLAR